MSRVPVVDAYVVQVLAQQPNADQDGAERDENRLAVREFLGLPAGPTAGNGGGRISNICEDWAAELQVDRAVNAMKTQEAFLKAKQVCNTVSFVLFSQLNFFLDRLLQTRPAKASRAQPLRSPSAPRLETWCSSKPRLRQPA